MDATVAACNTSVAAYARGAIEHATAERGTADHATTERIAADHATAAHDTAANAAASSSGTVAAAVEPKDCDADGRADEPSSASEASASQDLDAHPPAAAPAVAPATRLVARSDGGGPKGAAGKTYYHEPEIMDLTQFFP